MAVNKVDIYVSQLLEDLNNGLTWLKKDDLGYGNIETKYGANEKQIMAIRKHPALKNAETNITIFNIIDDTKSVAQEKQVDPKSDVVPAKKEPEVSPVVNSVADVIEDDGAAAFANL